VRSGAVLIVGHQPTLGRVAAVLLSGAEADWDIGKGALWWFHHDNDGETTLFAVIDPLIG
jgi:phosphohistidine phosphatase